MSLQCACEIRGLPACVFEWGQAEAFSGEGLFEDFFGAVGTAYEGAGDDVVEADFVGRFFVGLELARGNELGDFALARCRAKVLSDADGFAAGLVQIAEALLDLAGGLAVAGHERGLHDVARRVVADLAEEVEGGFVAESPVPELRVQFPNRLDVMPENFGLGVEDGGQSFGLAEKVGYEDFHCRGGIQVVNRADGPRDVAGAAVWEVVAHNGGDDRVPESHALNGQGDVLGLAGVQRLGPPGMHAAEATVARAGVAENHDGRGSVGPAFAEVGAVGALADGVQTEIGDNLFGRVEALTTRPRAPEPFWKSLRHHCPAPLFFRASFEPASRPI